MYRPLPESLTIAESDIDGHGLFATENIFAKTTLCHTHYDSVDHGTVRSPLGGFINHSDNPNCIILPDPKVPHTSSKLITVRPIRKGEELTVYYTMYKL